jgi:hypothetical protein
LCSVELCVPVYGRNREDTNFIVVREPECLCVAGHVNRIRKEVGVMVRLVEPIGSVLMGGIPCGVSRLYISWLEADVVFWISRGGRTLLPLL